MKIEQKQKNYQPITITLENEYEAEVLMLICASIAGDTAGARGITDKIYNSLMTLGVDYRDADFNKKIKSRGRIVMDEDED